VFDARFLFPVFRTQGGNLPDLTAALTLLLRLSPLDPAAWAGRRRFSFMGACKWLNIRGQSPQGLPVIFKGGAEQMASKAGARIKITLRCSECKQRNYNTMKNKKNTPDRLELNKYCPFCRKHTVHNETK